MRMIFLLFLRGGGTAVRGVAPPRGGPEGASVRPCPGVLSPPRVDEEGEAGQHHQQVHVGGLVPRLVHRVVDGAAVTQRRRGATAAGPASPRRRRHGQRGQVGRSRGPGRDVRPVPGAVAGVPRGLLGVVVTADSKLWWGPLMALIADVYTVQNFDSRQVGFVGQHPAPVLVQLKEIIKSQNR